jgi:hypothetical protein
MAERERVTIPADVYVQIERIRRSGEINMMDRRGVQHIANRRNFYAAACWLEDNREAYMRAFFGGSQPDRELTGEEQQLLDDESGADS